MAPIRPNSSISSASSSSASAKPLRNWWARAQLTKIAVVPAPDKKAHSTPTALSTSAILPSTKLSASNDKNPDMCEVYICTTKKPPALMAPALNASSSPSVRLVAKVRWRPVRWRSSRIAMGRS